ncbi:sensor histidine kinase [Clostridium magnum]|uniref:histidine kinase n=1 Tax=Clostridium magnum DSM 2767 TaxID=1121326 RepID=A0A162QEN6_9CLOT|nr:HAMP domain-containing sensor histidine kinase [Clostridium magnum]KZL88453.1 alkaline phosphatase synthesis sensor protein PhoR [Clostridium magnum DSM 2767]SHI90847.1 Signal transduction histidine kinase [Clostridium magnum DSM 2767]
MNKRSIVFKLFIITLLSFTVFLALFITAQTMFFKKFYITTKISKLQKNLNNFSQQYQNETWDSSTITKNINKFTDQNNAQIAVLDANGNVKYTPNFEIIIESSSRNKIKLPLSSIAYLDGFQNLKLTKGDEIEVGGYFGDDFSQVLSLLSIKNGNEKWENSNLRFVNSKGVTAVSKEATPVNDFGSNVSKTVEIPSITSATYSEDVEAVKPVINFKLEKIVGKIIELNIPSQIEQLSNYNTDLLWTSIDYWNWILKPQKIGLKPNKISNFHYSGGSNGMDNIALVKPIIKDNKISEFIFVITSLQPVGEAIDTMKLYYFYAFLFALLVIIGMSLLFSNILSKPLLKMNRVAVKMADLDFSEECEIHSKDELGSLSTSLNLLSKNLSSSLWELKIANEELQKDIDKERSLEKMRKEFIASVSHEFKTPLGVIKGFAEGVKDNIAEEKREYYIDVILDEIGKMDELVLDLLDLSRLESKVYKLKLEHFHVINLIDEVQSRLLTRANEKNLLVELQYEQADIEVYADRRRIEQVITNILSNAIRHTSINGNIQINVVKKDCSAYVSIENSGEHILEEDLIKIWDRFYRVEKSRDRKTGGTGLGLPIVKNILLLHESNFGVENTDSGVRFYFTLKL